MLLFIMKLFVYMFKIMFVWIIITRKNLRPKEHYIFVCTHFSNFKFIHIFYTNLPYMEYSREVSVLNNSQFCNKIFCHSKI